MTVGSLGNVVFSVSDKSVKTIKSMSWKTSVTYSVHKMHLRKGLLEYTGQNPDEIEFEAEFSAFLGINPLTTVQELRKVMEARTVCKFILGTDVIGTNWVVTDMDISGDSFYRDGSILSVSAKIKIKEYLEE